MTGCFFLVRRNELRSRLKNGEDVTLPDGRKILSKDVTLPGEPPVKVLSMISILFEPI